MTPTTAVVKRLLRASPARVFEAWSNPEIMSRWFVVDPSWAAKVSNDFRVGGEYRVAMRRGDGSLFVASGQYLEISPVTRLAFTWTSPVVQNTRVIVELKDLGDATELTLTHELFPDAEAARRDGGGWHGVLDNLARLVEEAR